MRHFWCDIETYCALDLTKVGVYRYAEDESFRIRLLASAWDEGEVFCEEDKEFRWLELYKIMTDPTIVKHAHNATFERVCFSSAFRKMGILGPDEWLDPSQWDCSMVLASRCGLPGSLEDAGAALMLDEQKLSEGKDLIKVLSKPNKKGEMVMPEDRPEDWVLFKAYCIRDVEVEREIARKCSWYPVSDEERNLYAPDQRINDHGVLVDRELARQAVRLDSLMDARLTEEARDLTGLGNPNSVAQLKGWLKERIGADLATLNKTDVAELKKTVKDNKVLRVLEIRAEMGKSSNAKYDKMLSAVNADGRVRGLTQFYGSRTGRWAGRLVQMQNLPQNHIDALDEARKALREGDYDMLNLGFGSVSDTMSQLIRTAFIAPSGKTFAVCDFSAIEARVLAWIAGEWWVLDAFGKGQDIYCRTASNMFGVPVEKHGENAHLRQRGKVAVLALGYQGGLGAMKAMGGDRLGMSDKQINEMVYRWRGVNKSIVSLWAEVEATAKECITFRRTKVIERPNCTLTFRWERNDTMTIELPSGRRLCYYQAQVPGVFKPTGQVNQPIIDGRRQKFMVYKKKPGRIHFYGKNQKTGRWEMVPTYGGKLVENITQAVARDCLATTLSRVQAEGYPICFHVHDELIAEVPELDAEGHLDKIVSIFAEGPAWAKGLPLKGAGYITKYYKKD